MDAFQDVAAEGRSSRHRDHGLLGHRVSVPWSLKGAYHHLDKLTEAAGVTCDGFHLLRHTRATRLLERGVPLHVVSTLLGHASSAETERVYAHADALAYAHYLD